MLRLCCIALPFAASADPAVDKDAGQPCASLLADFRCGIHAHLREKGFSGCTDFDCFGAGQQISQRTPEGRDWRRAPGTARRRFEVFPRRAPAARAAPVRDRSGGAAHRGAGARGAAERAGGDRDLTGGSATELVTLDVAALRGEVNTLLLRASELVRAEAGLPANHRDADLIGARLRCADLRGANLRGTYLVAADLRGADLRWADLIGADFRDASIGGADLTGSIFLTQAQLNAAEGSAATGCPQRSLVARARRGLK